MPAQQEHINYRSLCVTTKQYGQVLYPKTIPKERGPRATYVSVAFCLCLFLGDVLTDQSSVQTIMKQYTAGIILSVILQLLYRTILMSEEYSHLISRYDNKIVTLIKDTFHFRISIWVTLVLCILYNTVYGLPLDDIPIQRLVLRLTTIYLFGKVLKQSDCPLKDSLWVAENNGLDYGSGMAYSFYYGYLDYVLRETGLGDKNLQEMIRDYEDKNRVKFEEYKLFILIPKSMQCPVSLKNDYSPAVEESQSLEEKIISVAGVRDRVYKNSVYKIVSENGRRWYVAAEYATPLKTFKQVFDNSGGHSKFYDKLKKDIILQFYLSLGKVLEEKKMTQFCELIYFEDSYQDEAGQTRFYDVGKILVTRLKELRKKRE